MTQEIAISVLKRKKKEIYTEKWISFELFVILCTQWHFSRFKVLGTINGTYSAFSHEFRWAFYRQRVVTFSDNKESTPWAAYRTKRLKRTKSIKIPCPNPNCRSVFAWKKNLISHLRYQCGQQPRFKCPYCDYLCKIKTDVRKHIRAKHQNYDVHVIDIFQQ